MADSHAPVAPLLLVPVTDASGSMRATDPDEVRFSACQRLLAAVAEARPYPAKTVIAPIFFGSRTVALRPHRLSQTRKAPVFGWDLGNTDFARAIKAATVAVRAFHDSQRSAAGRAVVFIFTDGTPDLGDNRPASALWPGIEASLTRLRQTGAEIYILGVTNSSRAWREAALHWENLLGAPHVHLIRNVCGIDDLYRSFAQTALQIGKLQGAQLGAGRSKTLSAGDYASALTVKVTANRPGARVSLRGDAASVPISASLATRGEQRTWRISLRPHSSLVVRNEGRSPVLLSVRTETAVLQPLNLLPPEVGAPIDGYLTSLLDGLGHPILPVGNDPLALSAVLTFAPEAQGSVAVRPLQIRAYAPGRYALSDQGSWQSGPYRLTVLTRCASGAVGRADYQINPQLEPWARLAAPSRLASMADASIVRLGVTLHLGKRAVRPEQVSASGEASVLAQLCGLDGKVLTSLWMTESGDGSLTGSMPAVVHDGLLKLSVVDKRGHTTSTRWLLWHMRPTFAQELGACLFRVGVAAALGITAICLGLVLWLFLKPGIPGSLVVSSSSGPLRFEGLGRKVRVATFTDAAGKSRWLVLPASRSSVRLLRVGMLPRTIIINRGIETAFDGRVARLV